MAKMDIFISWHGNKSRAVADALRDWLPQIVNAFNPWLSSEDIDKGARWSSVLAAQLATAKAGIICLTPTNLRAPWILFEAGALSKTVESTYVVPFLIQVEQTEITGPLAQFQAVKHSREDVLRLMLNLNKALGPDSMPEGFVKKAFDRWWPELDEKLQKLPQDMTSNTSRRSERDLLAEVVELARQTGTSVAEMSTKVSIQYHNLLEMISVSGNRKPDALMTNMLALEEARRKEAESGRDLVQALEEGRRRKERDAIDLARAALQAKRSADREAATDVARAAEAEGKRQKERGGRKAD